MFHKMLVKDLETDRFILNPYDPCVDSNMVNGHHITVAWHVNYFKMSHKDPFGINMLAAYLKSIYGENMEVRRG